MFSTSQIYNQLLGLCDKVGHYLTWPSGEFARLSLEGLDIASAACASCRSSVASCICSSKISLTDSLSLKLVSPPFQCDGSAHRIVILGKQNVRGEVFLEVQTKHKYFLESFKR